jgi:hypothetical protein
LLQPLEQRDFGVFRNRADRILRSVEGARRSDAGNGGMRGLPLPADGARGVRGFIERSEPDVIRVANACLSR